MRLVGNVVEGDIHHVAKHDTEGGPHLPHHDESATNDWRGALSSVDGDGRRLGADTETEEEARDEEVPPGVGHALPDASREREEGTNEDGATTAEPPVERGGAPATDQTTAQLY